MKSLAERHADRAQRKADNAAFSNQNTGGQLGLAAVRIAEATAAINALTPEQREELKAMMPDDGFSDSTAEADAQAYDGQGNLKTAGIGVVNNLVAPVAAAMAVEGAGTATAGGAQGNGGWGSIPEPTRTPAQGNEAGAGQEGAQGGQGASGGSGSAQGEGDAERPAVNARMTVAELEAIASKEGADLSNASNNPDRVEAIEANRNKSA